MKKKLPKDLHIVYILRYLCVNKYLINFNVMAQVKKIKNDLQVALNTMFDAELSDSDKLRLLIFAVRNAIYLLSK